MKRKKPCALVLAVMAFWFQVAASGQTLDYSSFLGGSKEDGGRAYVTADAGSIIVASSTSSSDFPVTLPSTTGSTQVSITKLLPNGGGSADLVWSLLVGGSSTERVRGLDVDASGNIYVTGTTSSSDFGTSDTSSGPGIFVLKLTAGGSLVYSTVLGGAGGDLENGGLAADGAGNTWVTGSTSDASYPDTVGTTFSGGASDAVVTKLDPNGSIVYSRFLGGSDEDGGRDIVLDGAGNAYVLGKTGSPDFPVVGALQAQLEGAADAFVVRLDANGSISAATYLGGSDEEMGREGGIALGPVGTVWVTGRTQSTDFPTVNAFDSSANGNTEGFVAELSANLDSLLYATYLGGGSGERGTCVRTDDQGLAYVSGRTLSTDFPTTPNAFDTSPGGRHDGFFAVLDSSRNGTDTLVLSSFLAGSRDDGTVCLELGTGGTGSVRAYMGGLTASRNDFPLTAGAYDTTFNGGKSDIFVSVFDFVATPDPVCGNDVAEVGEVCDGADLGGQTCGDALGCVGGVLLCATDCQSFDTALCSGSNGVQEAPEECDGLDFGTSSCSDFGCGGGNLSCNFDCTIDASSCLACCTEVGQPCVKDSDCCSLDCSNGPPLSRVCLQ
jgi:hypothetical protein